MNKLSYKIGFAALSCLILSSCKIPALVQPRSPLALPDTYLNNRDTTNIANQKWRAYFKDPYLQNLIDTALVNNRELMSTLQNIEISANEVRLRKGRLLPNGGVRGGMGVDKVARYTSQGAGDASTDITTGKPVPEVLPDFNIGAYATWEVDIWKKLRTEKEAAVKQYLGTVEGKNFVVTNLVAEIANNYYELLALDKQLSIISNNIKIQEDALAIVKVQKEAARANELAVQKFSAEVFHTKSLRFNIQQQITETETNINRLLARFPQTIARSSSDELDEIPRITQFGIPAQLLQNRPDVRQAELEMEAAKLDVKAARLEFYPTLEINAFLGLQAFKPGYLAKLPESMAYSLVGDLVGPIINRTAIKAAFNSANAKQLQALFDYEKTLISAYDEVANQMANIKNLDSTYFLASQQVDALNKSISIANELFKYAKADYFEVLMTQRDALEAKMDLVETEKARMLSVVDIYRALGGGWQ